MSRWDALKPAAPAQQPTTTQQQKRRYGNRLPSSKTNIASSSLRSTTTDNNNNNNRNKAYSSNYRWQHKQQRQQTNPRTRYMLLRQQLFETNEKKDGDDNLVVIEKLAELISSSMDDLPVEQVAQETVYDILLPHLSTTGTTANSTTNIAASSSAISSQSNHINIRIFKLLGKLLNNSRYSSAMMAPIVDDINTITGEENQRMNPIRQRLFSTLQCMLMETISSKNNDEDAGDSLLVTTTTCQTLATALYVSYNMDGGTTKRLNHNYDVDVSAVKYFIGHVLQQEQEQKQQQQQRGGGGEGSRRDVQSITTSQQLISSALELLLNFLKRHPEAAAAFTLPLLENQQQRKPEDVSSNSIREEESGQSTTKSNPNCCGCGFGRGKSTFLNLLHFSSQLSTVRSGGGATATSIKASAYEQQHKLAIKCTSEVMNHSPFDLWLKQQQQQGRGSTNIVCSTLSYPDRIIACLHNTLRIVQCLITRGGITDYAAPLIKSLLLKIPYQKSDTLQASAHELVSILAKQIATSTNVEDCKVAIDILMDAAGGRMTPQGQLTLMSSPLRSWLNGFISGQDFVQKVLLLSSSTLETTTTTMTQQRVRLCKSFLQSCPGIVTANSDGWQAFRCSVEGLTTHSNDPKVQLSGLDLLLGLLQGRNHDHDTAEEDGNITQEPQRFLFIWPILLRMSCEGTSPLKRAASSAYANLLPVDWDELNGSGGDCLQHMHTILVLCNGKETIIQADCYKALGDMCTNYFSSSRRCRSSPMYDNSGRNEMSLACGKIIPVLVAACSHDNAKVRSMAVFALGNLTMALKDAPFVSDMLARDVDVIPVRMMANTVRMCMNDSDEKVVGNAIRTIGHVALLWETLGKAEDIFLEDVLNFLSQKVVSSSNNTGIVLSWKQKQVAKKHSWGACHTLARLFEARVINKVQLQKPAGGCLLALFDCVNINLEDALRHSSRTTKNDKIVCAASAALRFVESPTIARLLLHVNNHDSSTTARCMALSSSFVLKEQQQQQHSMTKVGKEIDLLLQHLLQSISVEGAAYVLQSECMGAAATNSSSGCGLSALCDWMIDRGCPVHSFGAFALAMQRQKINTKVVDGNNVDIELRFSRCATVSDTLESGWGDDEL